MKLQEVHCPHCETGPSVREISSRVQMHPGKEEFTFVKCRKCRLVYLNPVVPPEQIGHFYTDFYLPYQGAKAWGKWHVLAKRGERTIDKKRVKYVKGLLPLDASSKVLDIGCGRPSFLAKLREKTSCAALGLDFKIAGWRDEKEFQKISLLEGEVDNIPDSATFDLITMWHYLEHDYNPLATLQKLKKHSHKNTLLVIEVPDAACISRKWQGSQWAGYHTPRHVSVFERKTLRKVLEKSGWQEYRYEKNGTLNPYVFWWLGQMEKKNIDWSKSLEPHFLSFLSGYLLSAPLVWITKPFVHQGIQLAVYKPA